MLKHFYIFPLLLSTGVLAVKTSEKTTPKKKENKVQTADASTITMADVIKQIRLYQGEITPAERLSTAPNTNQIPQNLLRMPAFEPVIITRRDITEFNHASNPPSARQVKKNLAIYFDAIAQGAGLANLTEFVKDMIANKNTTNNTHTDSE